VGPTAAYWQNLIASLKPGDPYNLACSGPVGVTGVTPLFTTDPVQAMYDLYSCRGGPVNGFGDETTPLAQLDYWGSDFCGNPGILGQSGNYYTSAPGDSPNQLRAVSDFDTTHQFNLKFLAELPFGKGKLVHGNSHGVLDASIGG